MFVGKRRVIVVPILIAVIAVTVACGGPAATPTPGATNTPVPATNTPVSPAATAAPTPAPKSSPAATAAAMPTAAAGTPTPTAAAGTPTPTAAAGTPTPEPAAAGRESVFTLGEGSVARYKVEEVLARAGFKVATGETSAVSGQVVFDAAGDVVADGSRIAVQAATLRTDSDRRDGYVRNRTLETDTYPEVVFVPTGIGWQTPPAGELRGVQEFTISGDLTVKDRTRAVTWDATAEFGADGAATGQASVEFTFEDFDMDKPRVAVVVSVEDTIRLELDFVGTIAPR